MEFLDESLFDLLTPGQCWSRLGRDRLGRIAFDGGEGIDVLPVNYIVADGTIGFSTSSAAIIAAARARKEASFEVDQHDGVAAWSVLVKGRLDVAPLPDSARWRLRSMLPTAKSTDVRLLPYRLSGRLFDQA